MRLIDADALIKRFEGLRDEHETLAISYVALYEVLVAMPTAYDVDAVVAELESAENYYYDDKLDAEGDLIMFKSIEQEVAIEIVRKGGAE